MDVNASRRRKRNKKSCLMFKLSQSQYDYKYNMKGWSQIITWVVFTCTASTQGAHHIIHIHVIKPTTPPSVWRTSQPYGEHGARTRFASTTRQMLSTTHVPLPYDPHCSTAYNSLQPHYLKPRLFVPDRIRNLRQSCVPTARWLIYLKCNEITYFKCSQIMMLLLWL